MKLDLLYFSVAFGLSLLIGLIVFPILKRLKMGQVILHYVEEHKKKSGTPTMGGILFILGIAFTVWILDGYRYHLVTVAIVNMLAFGLIGFLDDFLKIRRKQNLGLKAYQKITFQILVAVISGIFVYYSETAPQRIPFTDLIVDLGWMIVPLVAFIFLSCTNSVNLTDGLDGLCGSVSLPYFAAFTVMIGYTSYNMLQNGMQLGNQYAALSGLCCAAMGAIIAFLLFNTHPAKMFMGDTGSMALGGLCASVAVHAGLALFIPLIGIMFVTSTVTVIMQVVSFKTRKKRIFAMAPYHHHLQQKGWSEPRISMLYATITIIVSSLVIYFSFFSGGVAYGI